MSFAIILIKIIPLWRSVLSLAHQWKQDDLLVFPYPGLFLIVLMGIDHHFKSSEILENLHLFRRSLCKLNHILPMKKMILGRCIHLNGFGITYPWLWNPLIVLFLNSIETFLNSLRKIKDYGKVP